LERRIGRRLVSTPGTGATRESEPALRAVWSAVDAAANPVSMLVMLAGLVRTLGAVDYGIIAIALAASGITMAVNSAIALTTTKLVSEVAARRDFPHGSVAGLIMAALGVVVAIDVALIGCVAWWREPLSHQLFGQTGPSQGLATVLLLAMSAVGIQQIDAVVGAAIRGLERFRRQALIELSMRVALTATVILVAWRSTSVTAVLVAQCLVQATFVLIRALALRELMPERRLFVRSSKRQVIALLRHGGWLWLAATAGVVYTNGDRIVIGRLFGPAVAGVYSIYVQISQLIHFVPSNLFAFSLSEFSRMDAAGVRRADIARTYRRYFFAACTCALLLALPLMVFWPLAVRGFAANVPPVIPSATFTLLALNFLLLSANAVPYYLLLALGRARTVSLASSGCMVISLLLMVALTRHYGAVGTAAARLAYGLGTLSFIVKAHGLTKTQPDATGQEGKR
jgi:O-antigen/teichoic acid export membrane protein